jgi:UDP-N-acetylmuramate dehydrogenase
MRLSAFEGLARAIEGRVDFDFPMSRLTSMRIGGPARAVAHPRDENDLVAAMKFCRQENLPFVIMGNGTNLLVLNGGLEAVVIRVAEGLNYIKLRKEQIGFVELEAGAGLSLRRLLGFAVARGLSGVEFLAGIPGTAGGAVATNAGAFGHAIADVIIKVRLVSSASESWELDVKEMKFNYRSAQLPHESAVSAVVFRLLPGKPEIIRKTIREHIKTRMRTQPIRHLSAGCIFKNPPGHFAGKLIEEAGMKGKRFGGAQISPLHANFIINLGQARAEDVLHLMEEARQRVLKLSGIELEPEIRVLGNPTSQRIACE